MITRESLKSIGTIQINAVFEQSGDEFNGLMHIRQHPNYNDRKCVFILHNISCVDGGWRAQYDFDKLGFKYAWNLGSPENADLNELSDIKVLIYE